MSAKDREWLQQTAEQAARPLDPVTVVGVSVRPGDLLRLSAQNERAEFWLVVERDRSSIRLVPADGDPIRAGADLTLPEAAGLGPLTLRCAFNVWRLAETVEEELRVGRLASDQLVAVREVLAMLDAGERPGSVLDQETETELEYRDLAHELAVARRELLERNPRHESASPVAPARRSLLAMAASLVLAILVGVIAGLAWRGGTEEDTAMPSEPRADIPFEWLAPRSSAVRGEEPVTVELTAAESHLALFLDVGMGATSEAFHLRIHRSRDGVELWSGEARRTGVAEIFLLLPVSGWPSGEYVVELWNGPRESSTEPFRVYTLRLERLPARSGAGVRESGCSDVLKWSEVSRVYRKARPGSCMRLS